MIEARTRRRAIVMLARAPTPGNVKTRLLPQLSARSAALLAAAFAADTAAWLGSLAASLNAGVFLYHTPDDAAGDLRELAGGWTLRPQGAGDLGRRLRTIVAALCLEGYDSVLLVGADSPTLPDACVAGAFAALDEGANVAIARADDGGYVLLCVDAPYAALFEEIPWSTDAVYDVSVKRAGEAGLTVRELSGWYDVDTVDDLARLRRECAEDGAPRAPRTARLLEKLDL